MRRAVRHVFATTVALTGCGPTGALAPPATPPPGDEPGPGAPLVEPGFLERYAETGGFSLGEPVAITVSPNGDAVFFLRSGPESLVRGLYVLDTATGDERELLTADRLLGGGTEVLSAEERARRERLRLSARGITAYELSRDGT